MRIEPIEAELLFISEPLLPVPGIKAVIGLPADELPGPVELDLLAKILKSLGLKHGSYRYVYFKTGEDLKKAEDLDVLLLIFSNTAAGNFPPLTTKSADCNIIKMPSLQIIDTNLELKREVWGSIKPFSGR